MERMKGTAPTEAVRCTIDGGQKAITEILVKRTFLCGTNRTLSRGSDTAKKFVATGPGRVYYAHMEILAHGHGLTERAPEPLWRLGSTQKGECPCVSQISH